MLLTKNDLSKGKDNHLQGANHAPSCDKLLKYEVIVLVTWKFSKHKQQSI